MPRQKFKAYWNQLVQKYRRYRGLSFPTLDALEKAIAETPTAPMSEEEIRSIVKRVVDPRKRAKVPTTRCRRKEGKGVVMVTATTTQTIWKYELTVTDKQSVEMPRGAEILCVQTQRGYPCLWVLVNAATPRETRWFETYETGHPCDTTNRRYIGTYQMDNGSLVFHVFERLKEN